MPDFAPRSSAWRSPLPIVGLAVLAWLFGGCPPADESLTSGDGASVLVPAGAWDGSEPLEVVSDAAPIPLPDGYTAVSSVYALLPHGATFDIPVTVSLPYTAGFLADLVVLRLGDDMDEVWQPLATATFDGETATFETLQFSWYVVAEIDGGGDDDDAADDDDSASDLLEYEGDLLIQDNAAMVSFCATFDRLTGALEIEGPGVTDGTALDCLVSIGGDLDVHDSVLPELLLPALVSVGGEIEFTSNTLLVDVSLPALTAAGSVAVSFCAALESLDLSSLETVGGDFTLEGVALLSSVLLPELVDVGGSFQLSGTAALVGLDLGALETVGGDFDVDAAVPLETIELGSLRTVGGTFASGLTETLTELDLGSLETVGGDLALGSSESLETLELDRLESVGGWLRISHAPVTDLWLGALVQAGTLWVDDLAIGALDLSALQQTTVGSVRLVDMQSVDLSALTTVAGSVVLAPVASATLDLPVLATAGSIDILDADATVTFQAPLLTSLGEELSFDANDVLSSIQLPSLGSVGGNFTILDNPALPTSQAEALRDQIGEANIGGSISIGGNGPG